MPRLGEVAKGAGPLLDDAEQARRLAMRTIVSCRGEKCGAKMFFVEGPNGKPMPLNAELTTVMLPPEEPDRPWRLVRGHVPHHITCPDSDKFRNRGQK